MTTPAAAKSLYGTASPSRSRWEPLRAGIVGLFRYDEQVFTFHKGRLLLRGDNGSGKSMALEVLLPYVLDADLASERLSTFAVKDRGMFLWLLGHDANQERSNARGYVWVEFGRTTDEGEEFCTVGAGLQTTRASKRVTAWYFTTAGRPGIDFDLGTAGTETKSQPQLVQTLTNLSAQALPGQVHPTPDAHRKEVNRVLFGLDDRQFEALRKTMLQLRKPKLSDKLSEDKLDMLLRDSLPPVSEVVTNELADGFERLDRHREVIAELTTAHTALTDLHKAYTYYLDVLTGRRATDVVEALRQVDQSTTTAKAAEQAQQKAEADLAQTQEKLKLLRQEIKAIRNRIEAIKELDVYKEGSQLIPLSEKAAALRDAANGIRVQAEELKQTAVGARNDAVAAEQAAAEATQVRGERATRADQIAGRLPIGDLALEAARLIAALDESPDANAAMTALRESTRLQLQEIDRLRDLVRRVRTAVQRLNSAHSATTKMKERVAEAERKANEARQVRHERMTAYLETVSDWIGRSTQLVLGAPAPQSWPSDRPGQAVSDWARQAAQTRRAALAAEKSALAEVQPAVGPLSRQADELTGRCTALSTAVSTVWAKSCSVRDARIAFAQQVTTWAGTLVELSVADGVPEFVHSPVARTLTRSAVAAWAVDASTARVQEIEREAAAVRADLVTTDGVLGQKQAEHARLAGGGLPALPRPYTRLTEREELDGSPFFLLVDFVADDQSRADRRALLEAALVGCGLADAWVFPDGTLATGPDGDPLLDVVLTTDHPASASPLSAALRPDPALPADGPVPSDVVHALLTRIGLADTAQGQDGLTVAWDGTWSAGPLRGAFRKDTVDLIGAGSREVVRLRRMEELAREIEVLERTRSSLQDQIKRTVEAAQRTSGERTSVPADDPVHEAEAASSAAIGEAITLMKRAAEDATALFVAAHQVSTAALNTFASLGLPADIPVQRLEMPGFEQDVTAVITMMPDRAWSDPHVQPGTTAINDVLELVATAAAGWEVITRRTAEALASVTTRTNELEHQIGQQPSDKALTDATYEVDLKAGIVRDKAADLTSAQAEESAAAEAHEDAVMMASTALDLAGLAGHGERLDAIRTDTEQFRTAAEDWINAASSDIRLTHVSAKASGNARAAEEIAASSAKHAAKAQEDAQLARRKYDDLNAKMGKPHQELMAELDLLRITSVTKTSETETHAAGELELGRTAERKKQEAVNARTKVSDARARLTSAAEALADVHRLGLLQLPEGSELPARFSPEALRPDQIETVCGWGRLLAPKNHRNVAQEENAQTLAGRARTKAEPSLSGQVVVRERYEHGIFALTGSRNGLERSVHDTLVVLTRDLTQTEELLEKEEAELFERFLSDEVRLEVGDRIQAARSLVERMNALMTRHSTTSGYTFMLSWEAAAKCDVPDDMMDLLQKPEGTLYRSQRDRLSEFYRRRIASTRVTPTSTPWREQLATMLDYRSWHKFELLTKKGKGDSWAKLNRRRHNAMSGGERAVALHLPLFAAAATHCEASRHRVQEHGRNMPGCPRLILLDEVFAGVDARNRGALFKLITELDLDLVATSESELGLYPELDGISIYHLIVEDGLPGLLAARSIWDGTMSHDMLDHDQEALV